VTRRRVAATPPTYRSGMGAAGAADPCAQAGWPPCHTRPPGAGQRHAVLAAVRLRLAAAAPRPSALANGLPLLARLAPPRPVGTPTWVLRAQERTRQGRTPTPSAGILDSQSVKTTKKGGRTATTAPRSPGGRKRHLPVDTLGLICKAHVTPTPATVTAPWGCLGAWTAAASPGCGMAGPTRATAAPSLTGRASATGSRSRSSPEPMAAGGAAGSRRASSRRLSRRLRWCLAGGSWRGPLAGWAGSAASPRTTSSFRRPRRRSSSWPRSRS
jgi:hypothetical protein